MNPRSLALGISVAAVVVATTFVTAQAQAAIPTMARAEIIARAESAIGTSYTWGGESWVPNSTSTGPDCSGLVLKCWEVPRSLLYQEEDGGNTVISPRYTSYDLYNCSGPWYRLSDRSSLAEGDALAYNDGSSGHVMLYAGGDAYSYPVVYEAPYPGAVVRKISRYVGSEYVPLRRTSMITDGSIILDNPTAKSTGGDDLGGNWTRSTSNSGYYGADYQVHAAAAPTAAAWARWTPRLLTSGYYNVYLRWTSGWNRASNAKVTINTPSGQLIRYVDQRSGGGAWVKIGRYYLNAGYGTGTGSISVHAAGADGYVVADAALFALAP